MENSGYHHMELEEGCLQSLDWTGLDWTGLLDSLKIQHYNRILVSVHSHTYVR